MTATAGSGDSRGRPGVYKDKSKPADIRASNIQAAKGNKFSHDYYYCIFKCNCIYL